MSDNLNCDVCNGESGGTFVGVAALSTGPMSVAFCNNCLRRRAEPTFALDYLIEDVAGKDPRNLNPDVFMYLNTWYENRYMSLQEYWRIKHSNRS